MENINLECSEKIFKFIRESAQKGKENYKKNKSNLLSTGIINLSHPNGEGKEERGKTERAVDSHNIEYCSPLNDPVPRKTEQLKHKLSKFNQVLL